MVENDGDDRTDIDWTTLSRRHALEVDVAKKIVTIFGGKLTDCLNVGEEVVEAIEDLGVPVGPEVPGWYGEAPDSERERFETEAAALGLDRRPSIERAGSVAEVLWRRHGVAAFDLLKEVAEDPSLGEEVLVGSDILRGELHLMAEREMVTRLDDFLRRRTKLSLVIRNDELGADPGMSEVNAAFGL